MSNRSLAQTLAVQTQLHMPGTVGRLLQQIRDLEQLAPLFVEAGLVKPIERPNPLNINVVGIATKSAVQKTLGGFLYASAAVSLNLTIQNNAVSTTGQDSLCELDDIDFVNQSKRLALIQIRQSYQMAEQRLSSGEPIDLILMDCPLFLGRDMAPLKDAPEHAEYRNSYDQTLSVIDQFWQTHKGQLYPWNPSGPVLAGIASEKLGAILYVAKQDLRTSSGMEQLLSSEGIDPQAAGDILNHLKGLASIGEQRFINGILSSFTRTAAFRISQNQPRLEPKSAAENGLVGFHFKGGNSTGIRLVQLAGDEPDWESPALDKLCGQLMCLMAVGGQKAFPLPIQLAEQELKQLDQFVKYYKSNIQSALKSREVEDIWLSDLDGEF
ncbi:TPA: hypothetical protein P0E04_000129 [Vibrio campbellii]|uniref:hypothetical protein n=1 Tax=Vibrio TaxID=662 RepID=UPI00063C6F17|nr:MULTISPECIES: hypothetical protein [Vibrio]MCG9582958.1 hypothetical protein [Vibrio tubiashii]MCG9616552.1 hypothetical protein [Vibrio tubiashii]MCG9686615.1 hypothetical protein [Vibrio tubiashii]HDM8042051.1 hypothetical protein [Vibrio campbellii]